MAEQIENTTENLSENPRNPLAEPGSIAVTAARLTRWGRLAPQGLARVEFISEFSRQRVVSELRDTLRERDIPFHEIELPVRTPAVQIVNELKAKFQTIPEGVVSLSGFETAFPSDVPLTASLRILNFNRENLADHPLRQIWWMTPVFAQEFVQTVPDLDSWFIIKTTLRDVTVLPDPVPEATPEHHEALTDAYAMLAYLRQRFAIAAEAGASSVELLQIILPAYRRLCGLEPAEAVKAKLDETFQFLKTRDFDVDAFIPSDEVDVFVERRLLFDLAMVYQCIGLYQKAERLLHKGMETQIQLDQWLSDDYTPLGFTKALARLYVVQEKFAEAECLLDRLSAFSKQTTDEAILWDLLLGELAVLYSANHCYQKAEKLFLSALKQPTNWLVRDAIAGSYARFLRRLGRDKQADLLEKEYELLYVQTPLF